VCCSVVVPGGRRPFRVGCISTEPDLAGYIVAGRVTKGVPKGVAQGIARTECRCRVRRARRAFWAYLVFCVSGKPSPRRNQSILTANLDSTIQRILWPAANADDSDDGKCSCNTWCNLGIHDNFAGVFASASQAPASGERQRRQATIDDFARRSTASSSITVAKDQP
jgi:hypothetical protein